MKKIKLNSLGILAVALFTGTMAFVVKPNFSENKIKTVEAATLSPCTYLRVNKYNNNVYKSSEHLYQTMIEFDNGFANETKVNINIATASEELGNKMTLNGVPVKDIPGFFASYNDAGKDGQMIFFKIPEAYMAPSNGYSKTTLFMPKGTVIYDGITTNDVELFLTNNKWLGNEKWSLNPEPIDDYDYSFAIVGDTQDVNISDPTNYHKIYDWIVDNKDDKKIAYTIGLGDITNNDTQAEWDRARASFDQLEAHEMRHTQVRGNHDSKTAFKNFFDADEYYNEDIIETYETIANCYREFKVGKTSYLMLSLDYEPSNAAIDWANNVVEKYPDHNVIVITHGYLYRDGTTLSPGDDLCPSINNGEDIWQKLVKKHKNITMVLSGHIYCDNILVSTQYGENGNKVTQVLIDPQQMDRDGLRTGLVAMFYFSNGGRNVQVEYYSTILEAYEITSPIKKFSVNKITPVCKEHSFVEHPAVSPTCTESGNVKYYTCDNDGCDLLFIEDKSGNKVETTMESIILPPQHSLTEKPVFNFSSDGKTCTVSFVCDECKQTIVDNAVVTYYVTKKSQCTEPGEITYTATYAGYTDTKVFEIPATGHDKEAIETVPAKEATCLLPGHKEAYYCNDCEFYYEDKDMQILIGDENAYEAWIAGDGKITADHNFIKHAEIPATCTSSGSKEYYECKDCHQYFSSIDPEVLIGNAEDLANWIINPNGGFITIDKNNHASEFVKHNESKSTCSKQGNIEYYSCPSCGDCFIKNGDNFEPVSSNEVMLPLDPNKHNLQFIEEVAATTVKDGTKAHYECKDCGQLFIKNGDTYTKCTLSDLVIPKLTPDPEPKKGCGGSIIATSVLTTILSICSFGLILLKKKVSIK